MKLEIPDFELHDDPQANLNSPAIVSKIEEVCVIWNKQIMDAMDNLLQKAPEGIYNQSSQILTFQVLLLIYNMLLAFLYKWRFLLLTKVKSTKENWALLLVYHVT